MKPRIVLALALAVLVGAGWAWHASDGGGADRRVRRAAVTLPAPDEEAAVRYFVELMESGAVLEVGADSVPIWRTLAEPAVLRFGTAALDVLLAEDRIEHYRRSPNLLANVLRILPGFPGAADHPRLHPFVLHWLDHEPLRAKGSDWREELEKLVFLVLLRAPDERAVPASLRVLRTPPGVHDLREAALSIVLQKGPVDDVVALFPTLPPHDDDPAMIRVAGHQLIYEFANPGRPDEYRRRARAFTPMLEQGLQAPEAWARLWSAATLLRLGDEQAAEVMFAEFRELRDTQPEMAWSHLKVLLANRVDPRIREICLAHLAARETADLGVTVSVELLVRGWGDDAAVREAVWPWVDRPGTALDKNALRRLAPYDRARTIAVVRRHLGAWDSTRTPDAIDFTVSHPLPELVPELIDLLRATDDRTRRARYHALLARLQVPEVVPLIVADLEHVRDRTLRAAAYASLLESEAPAAEPPLLRALESHDIAVLDAVVGHAAGRGARGIPEAVLRGVAEAAGTFPGEQARIQACLALRYAGRKEGVVETLQAAYRREPSGRVASQIRTTLVELAHRLR